MMNLLIILLTLFQPLFGIKFPFTEYTLVSKAFDGTKCLTGCSAENECVINWKWDKLNCRTTGIAPIYRTSRVRDPLRKYCLSNCGFFGESYQWCITTEDLKWDYCNPEERTSFLKSQQPETHTRNGDKCLDQCTRDVNGKDGYYWCYYTRNKTEKTWEYCAPSPLPRIPVLDDSFQIGHKLKGNCDGFLKYATSLTNCLAADDAADNFLTDLADAIDGSVMNNSNNTLTQIVKVVDSTTPIQSYTMVNINGVAYPAVIRAHVTNQTVHIDDTSEVPAEINRKLRDQMSGNGSSYEAGRLIGSQLGGPNTEYNVVPRSVHWKSDEWWDMEQAVRSWCMKSGGTVDMVVVVFYKDENTPIPNAFGVSLVFRNDDNSLFVDCREKIHWNNF